MTALIVLLMAGGRCRFRRAGGRGEVDGDPLRTAVVLINFTDDAIDSSPEYRDAVPAKYFGYHHLSTVKCADGRLTNCRDAGYHGSSPMGGGGVKPVSPPPN